MPEQPNPYDASEGFHDPAWEHLKAAGRVVRSLGKSGVRHWRAFTFSAVVGVVAYVAYNPVSDAVERVDGWHETCFGDADTPEQIQLQQECRDDAEQKAAIAAGVAVGAGVVAVNTAVGWLGLRWWARRQSTK